MTNQNTNSNSYLFTLTECSHDTDRVATPLVLANSALANGGDALLWLTMSGVNLARSGSADQLGSVSFAPVKDLLDSFIEAGGRIGVCPPCGKTHGVTADNMIDNAEWMGAVAMLAETQNHHTFSF